MGIREALAEAAARQQALYDSLRKASAEDTEKEAESGNDETTPGESSGGRNNGANA